MDKAATSSGTSTPAGRVSNTTNANANPQRAAFLRSASVPTLDKAAPRLVPRWVFAEGKTWVPFGIADSTRLEDNYAQLGNKETQEGGTAPADDAQLPEADATRSIPTWRVPVGEDHMLEVDLRHGRAPKLHSIFWKSPPVDVRRGEWFFESSRLAPCEIELSNELSELYTKIQPWTSAYAEELKASASIGSEGEEKLKCTLKSLKGSYVIFSGSHLARIYQEGVSQRLAKTLLTAWSGEHGGGTLVVRGYDQMQKLLKARRGDSSKKAKKAVAAASAKSEAVKQAAAGKTSPSGKSSPLSQQRQQRQLTVEDPLPVGAAEPQTTEESGGGDRGDGGDGELTADKAAQQASATQAAAKEGTHSKQPSASQPQSDLWTSFTSRLGSWGSSVPLSEKTQRDISESFRDAQSRISESLPEAASEVNAREARASAVIEEDDEYEDDEEEEWSKEREAQEEEVELVICWHGIGQKLAEEWKALEFSLAVNSLKSLVRKKSKASAPSSIGGEGFQGLTRGKRLAFLPINWRATLNDFQPTKEREEEVDENEYLDNQVGLDDIFGRSESIPLARSLTKNLLLDIPLFLSHHRPEVLRRCVQETNRAYALFCQRNPDFRRRGGKVSMICHSLGAVLAADVLSSQPTHIDNARELSLNDVVTSPHLAFNVRSLYLCGSPSALFFYLQSRQLIARRRADHHPDGDDAPRPDEALDRPVWGCLSVDRIWNVYNSTDPIATCLNGCVDTRLARKLEPLGMDRVVNAVLGTLPGANPPQATNGGGGGGGNSSSSAASTAGGQKALEPSTSSSGGLFGSWGRGNAPPSHTAAESSEDLPDLVDAASGTASQDKATTVNAKRDSWASRIALTRKKAADHADKRTGSGSSDKKSGTVAVSDQAQEGRTESGSSEKKSGTVAAASPAQGEQPATSGLTYPPAPPAVEEATEAEHQGAPATAAADANSSEDASSARPPSPPSPTTHMKTRDLTTRFDRAHRRMLRLNPLACIDYVIPKAPQSYLMPVPSSMLEYVGMLQAHATYWTSESFVEFLIATVGLEGDGGKARETLYGSEYEREWERKYLDE